MDCNRRTRPFREGFRREASIFSLTKSREAASSPFAKISYLDDGMDSSCDLVGINVPKSAGNRRSQEESRDERYDNCSELGHRVALLPPHVVRPYVQRNKTDQSDAKGMLEAYRNKDIKAVPVKSNSRNKASLYYTGCARHGPVREQLGLT